MARITGKNAALYLGVTPTKVGDIFEWTFETTTENLSCDIKGDTYGRYVPSHGNGRITAERYVNTTALFQTEAADAAINGEQQTFRLDLIDATAAKSQISGTAFVSRAALNAPRGMVVDNFEMVLDGPFIITLPGSN